MSSPRLLSKRRSNNDPCEPRTPPSLRTLARRLEFSPIASPSRHPVTAKSYHEALETEAGAAAKRALSIRPTLHASLISALSSAAKCGEDSLGGSDSASSATQLPAPALLQLQRPLAQQKKKKQYRPRKTKAVLLFQASLKAAHPVLEACADVLAKHGVPDLDTLRSLSAEERDLFLGQVEGLSTLQRSLLKTRVTKTG